MQFLMGGKKVVRISRVDEGLSSPIAVTMLVGKSGTAGKKV